eukprot:3600487-Amphidinium_carterae.1
MPVLGSGFHVVHGWPRSYPAAQSSSCQERVTCQSWNGTAVRYTSTSLCIRLATWRSGVLRSRGLAYVQALVDCLTVSPHTFVSQPRQHTANLAVHWLCNHDALCFNHHIESVLGAYHECHRLQTCSCTLDQAWLFNVAFRDLESFPSAFADHWGLGKGLSDD